MGGGSGGATLCSSGWRLIAANGVKGLDSLPRNGAGRNASGALWDGAFKTASSNATEASVRYTVDGASFHWTDGFGAVAVVACQCDALVSI